MASSRSSQRESSASRRTSASGRGRSSSPSSRSRSASPKPRTAPKSVASRASAPKAAGRKPASKTGTKAKRRTSAGSGLGSLLRSAPLLVAGVLIFSVWTFYPALKLQYVQTRENSMLESELQGLKARNKELRKQVDRLKTPEGVEDAARENLGLVRPGENQYVVTGLEETESVGASGERTTSPKEAWWVPLLDVLFGSDTRPGS